MMIAFATTAFAQAVAVEKGSPDDLRGATTICVDAGIRGELRDAILANLRTELPRLTVVERPEDAALVLRFSTTIGNDTLGENRGRSDSTGLNDIAQTDGAPKPRMRTPPSDRPGTVDPSRELPRDLDSMDAESSLLRTYRYAIGSILKPAGPDRFVEPVTFKRKIGDKVDRAVRDFVRKFAKTYRKANDHR